MDDRICKEKHRIIFMEEYWEEKDKITYLAIFLNDFIYPWGYGAIPFGYDNGEIYFEPYTEISIDYMDELKAIHSNDTRIPRLKKAIEDNYGISLVVFGETTSAKRKGDRV